MSQRTSLEMSKLWDKKIVIIIFYQLCRNGLTSKNVISFSIFLSEEQNKKKQTYIILWVYKEI